MQSMTVVCLVDFGRISLIAYIFLMAVPLIKAQLQKN